jgi:hypothetical protein
MDPITIFLASSAELEADRREFEILIGRSDSNKYQLKLVIWEDFLDVMARTRLQDKYNEKIRSCDIFVLLFFTKVGRYTDEEFTIAHTQFLETGRPRLFIFIKEEPVRLTDLDKEDVLSFYHFREKLEQLGHWPSKYKNIEDLKFQFITQLDKLLGEGPIRQTDLASDLRAGIDEEIAICRTNNIYLYTPFLMRALLRQKNSHTAACLNATRNGYAQLLQLKLDDLLRDMIAQKKGNPFAEEDLLQRPDMQQAIQVAVSEGATVITERHLLLGILSGESGTTRMIKQHLGADWEDFLACAKGSANLTPY